MSASKLVISNGKGRVIYYQVGGRLHSGGGVGIFFGDVLGGLKIKIPWGRGGHIFHQVFGGVRCVPLVFAFIKSQSFWGAKPPRPPPHIQNDTANNIRYSK